jgi:hypothetical protein
VLSLKILHFLLDRTVLAVILAEKLSDTPQYGSLKNAMKTKEINKGFSLSGVEWDTHGNQ